MIGWMILLAVQGVTPATAPIPSADAPARIALASFGACIADRRGREAAAVLKQDFRTPAFRAAMRVLTGRSSGCLASGRLQSAGVLIGGAIAERLLAQGGADTVGQRLALAAARPPVATYGSSDAAASCVIRAEPGEVAALFASAPLSTAESRAMLRLRAAFQRCVGGPVRANDEGLRAILATAAFRSVAAINRAD